MRGELGKEHPSQRDQHVQRPWGRKEFSVYEDLEDQLVGALEQGAEARRGYTMDGGLPATVSLQGAHLMCSHNVSCSETDVNGLASVFWSTLLQKGLIKWSASISEWAGQESPLPKNWRGDGSFPHIYKAFGLLGVLFQVLIVPP